MGKLPGDLSKLPDPMLRIIRSNTNVPPLAPLEPTPIWPSPVAPSQEPRSNEPADGHGGPGETGK